MKQLLKIICNIFLFIWTLPQNIVGILYALFGKYKLSKLPKYEGTSQKVKNMKDNIDNTLYFWKNVYDFKKKKHRKANTWIIGNFVFVKISIKNKVSNYKVPYSDLQFASGYKKLSNILGPLYIFTILIPTIFRNFRYDHFYSKKYKNDFVKLDSYWYNWWLTKLINKVLTKK